jgi:decaprenylphospho-beta-D-erythro-pentofuranosid-2-ulose 2-reductase
VLFDALEDLSKSATKPLPSRSTRSATRTDLVIIAVGLARRPRRRIENDAAAKRRNGHVVNCAWPVAALAEVRRRLVAQGSGRILIMSSMAALRVRRSDYLYDGAKAGLDRLCHGLSASLEGTGVTLQILRPGYVRSKMTAGTKERPFTTGVERSGRKCVMKGLASGDRWLSGALA